MAIPADPLSRRGSLGLLLGTAPTLLISSFNGTPAIDPGRYRLRVQGWSGWLFITSADQYIETWDLASAGKTRAMRGSPVFKGKPGVQGVFGAGQLRAASSPA